MDWKFDKYSRAFRSPGYSILMLFKRSEPRGWAAWRQPHINVLVGVQPRTKLGEWPYTEGGLQEAMAACEQFESKRRERAI